MTRNQNAIYVTEGEIVTYTITVKRAGSVVDLSSPAATVTFWAHDSTDQDVAFGTNKIDGASTTFATDGSDGVVNFKFSTEYSTFATDRDFEGVWALKISSGTGATTVLEWTKQEPIFIIRNPFVVEGS